MQIINNMCGEGLSFDDVLLIPCRSDVLPKDVNTTTYLTRDIQLNIPIVSAAMDTVTEYETAIQLARQGGLGFIHRNMSIDRQVREVERVKKSESGMIINPITIHPDKPVRDVLKLMHQYSVSGVPVTQGKILLGIVTNRDLRFETNLDTPVSEVMTKDNLVTVSEGITLEESKKLLHQHRIEKLLVVDKEDRLVGMITIKDIEKIKKYPNACKDDMGRLRVGAAVGVGVDMEQRTQALWDAHADVIVIDAAHGHSKNVIEAVRTLKSNHPDMPLIAGNVATEEGAGALIQAGADGIKIGIGPGSICTTRIVAGIGVPQITAIANCREISEKNETPIIADGGIKYSGDVAKAIGAGAHSVMIGGLFAGTDESPGEMIIFQGRSYKVYRGMGSIEAMKERTKDRYHQEHIDDNNKLVPEGIEGRVPYKGTLAGTVHQIVGGLKSGMGYMGSKTIEELRKNAQFIRISSSGLRESHVHDVIITKEAPNYRLD